MSTETVEKVEGEIVKPESTEEEVKLVLSSGTAVSIWADAASTFVPALRADMTPEERRNTIRDVAKKATVMDDKLNLVLGEMLHEAANNKYYADWTYIDDDGNTKTYSTFEEYAEIELDMKKRKADYLKTIYNIFVHRLKLPLDTLRNMSWTKARELLPVIGKDKDKDLMKPEDVVELIEKTQGLTVLQIKALVRKMLGKEENEDEEQDTVKLNFKCFPKDYEVIKSALTIAQTMTGTNMKEVNLKYICADFIAGVGEGGYTKSVESLEKAIGVIQDVYKVKLKVEDIDKDHFDKLKSEEEKAKEIREESEKEESNKKEEEEQVASS